MDLEKYAKARDLQVEIYDIKELLDDVRAGRNAENAGAELLVGDIEIALPLALKPLLLDVVEKHATTELARLRAEFDAL